MSFEAPRTIGLVEKAAKIALKRGVVYNATWNEFKGESDAVQKATDELKKWATIEESKRFRDQRQTY